RAGKDALPDRDPDHAGDQACLRSRRHAQSRQAVRPPNNLNRDPRDMFEALQPSPPDKILSLIGLLRDDPRPHKIDLGVGVYRDSAGRTPVMRAVREAERRLYDTEETKAYLGPGGDPAYCAGIAGLVFGDALPA